MPDPVVSVIVPTQGKRDSLRGALESIAGQTCRNHEVILVDDSRPEAGALTQDDRWRDLLQDVRVRVIPWHRCRGCSAAKQRGLEAARAPWVCYLDDDNLMKPDRLTRCLELAEHSRAKVSLCGFEIQIGARHRRRQVNRSEFRGDDRLLRATPDTNVLFHARELNVSWEPDLMTSDDAVFFHRIVATQAVEVVPNMAEPLVVYRVYQGERANSDPAAIRAGQRRLLPILRRTYSVSARKLIIRRMLVTNAKFDSGYWGRFWQRSIGLVRVGGWRELRMALNAAGFKWPVTRPWVVH